MKQEVEGLVCSGAVDIIGDYLDDHNSWREDAKTEAVAIAREIVDCVMNNGAKKELSRLTDELREARGNIAKLELDIEFLEGAAKRAGDVKQGMRAVGAINAIASAFPLEMIEKAIEEKRKTL